MLEVLPLTDFSAIQKLSIRDKQWKYRGEGNANLVLALPQERVILRLHKIKRDQEITPELRKEEFNRVWREVLFCRSVMVPLLGKAYIQPPIPAKVDQEEVEYLDNELRNQRPGFRDHKAVRFDYVTIYPDYALLPIHLCTVEPTNNSSSSQQHYMPILIQEIFELDESPSLSVTCINTPNLIEKENRSEDVGRFYSPQVVCSTRGKCISMCYSNVQDIERHNSVLEDISRVSTIVCGTVEQKCVNKYCILSYPILPKSCLYMMPMVNRKFSKNHFHNICMKYQNIVPQSVCQNGCEVANQTAIFCVEIKPKQGWIPPIDRRHPKCTFCLNQYLKVSNKTVTAQSQYCPMDLFSGDPQRMKKSIKALLSSPQNNLKIFQDGQLVYSDEKNSDVITVLKKWLEPSSSGVSTDPQRLIEKFCCLVLHALTFDLLADDEYPKVVDNCPPPARSSERLYSVDLSDLNPPCDWSSQDLPHNCILDRILRIQKLEQCGSDIIYQMYKSIVDAETDYAYVNHLQESTPNILSLDPIKRYLLATTAKDCSILIAFQSVGHLKDMRSSLPVCDRHVAVDLDGINYIWNVGVSDLDPKPLSCIEKHRKRDQDVLAACINAMKDK